MLARPGVEKGRHVPSPHILRADQELSEEAAKKNREWILQGQENDAK